MKRLFTLVATFVVVFIVACGPGAGSQPATQPAVQPKPAGEQPAPKAAAQPAASKPAGEKKKILLATGIDAAFTHFIVALKKGFFDKYNIQAEYKPFDDGNVALDAILTGSADLGSTSEFAGVVRYAKGGKIYLVATGARSKEQIGVAGKNTINSPKDFEGKKVGVVRASGGHYTFIRYVKRYNLDPNKIQMVSLPAPESVAALRRGDIDAIFIWEPWITRAVKEVPNTKVIARSGDDNVYVLTVYTHFGQRLIDDKELGGNVLKAIAEASDWIKPNLDEAAQILGQTYNIPVADAKTYTARFEYDTRYTPDIRKSFDEGVEFLKEQKLVDSVPNFDNFFHPEILKAAMPDRVKS